MKMQRNRQKKRYHGSDMNLLRRGIQEVRERKQRKGLTTKQRLQTSYCCNRLLVGEKIGTERRPNSNTSIPLLLKSADALGWSCFLSLDAYYEINTKKTVNNLGTSGC